MVSQKVLHYQLLEKIGAGGMGEIYKAQDTRLNRLVAVKILSPSLSADPERRRRFFQEAQAASALNHPNIITLYDIVSDGDLQCIVMEYIAGKTLRELIPARGLPPIHALQYGAQIASALAAAHSAGIIHRDLKPSNIMVTSTGLVKVLDFGLAKWVGVGFSGPAAEQQTTAETGLTREGSIIGTVSYMSPEQAEGKHVDARSDIFSFGDVLYEMVTGRRAFEGRSGISTLSSILRDDVRPISEAAPDVPPVLVQIILRCLPKDPNARWQSMKEIEAALTALLRQLDPAGQYAPPVPSVAVPPVMAPITVIEPSPVSVSPDVAPPGSVLKEAPVETRAVVAPVLSKPVATPNGPGAKSGAPGRPAQPVRPRVRTARSQKSVLALYLIGAVLVASIGIGGWWWWTTQQQAQSAPSAASVTPAEQPAQVATASAPSSTSPSSATAPSTTPPSTAPTSTAAAPTVVPATPTPATGKSPEQEGKKVQKRKPKPVEKIAEPPPPAPVAPATHPVVAPPAPLPPAPKATARPPEIPTVPISVADGMPFQVILENDVPADEPEGFALTFTVGDDLKVGDKTVIAKGATVSGMVTGESNKKGFLGIGGGHRMMFRLNQVNAVDGKKLSIRVLPTRPGDGIAVRPLEGGRGPKAKGFAAVQGTVYLAYIDGDQIVAVHK